MSRNDYLAGFEACRREALDAINESVIHRKAWRKQVNELLRAIRPCSGVEAGPTRDQQLLQDINDRIMWMAEQYAEAGGSRGPEMEAYREINARLGAALARVKP